MEESTTVDQSIESLHNNGTEEEEIQLTGQQGEIGSPDQPMELPHKDRTEHAHSIYGSTTSSSTSKRSGRASNKSTTSSIAAKRADAAAELAGKEAEYEMAESIARQKLQLERLNKQKDIMVARARLQAYTQEMEQEASTHLINSNALQQNHASMSAPSHVSHSPSPIQPVTTASHVSPSPIQPVMTASQHVSSFPSIQQPANFMTTSQQPVYSSLIRQPTTLIAASQQPVFSLPSIPQPAHSFSPTQQPTGVMSSSPPSNTDLSFFAQAVQDSMALNRLPIPEPSVFYGDPIHFIEWKASFVSLIDRKTISSADKLHYLKRYVGGTARMVLDGIFFRSDDEAYKDAWSKLNKRYGQPFIIQRAFRERLAQWPKIQPNDAEGLRSFTDFLIACQEAMPHVEGLDILNDCEENQKLVRKLPDWAAARWNRQVTMALNETQKFPSFRNFSDFMSMESEIACNPITSFNALRAATEFTLGKQNNPKGKTDKVSVFHTQVDMENNDQECPTVSIKACLYCQDNNHLIHYCTEFVTKPLEEKRLYIKENKLCYGCMESSHFVKDCQHRHSCNTCKGKHPTCLHDDDYIRKANAVPIPSQGNTGDTAMSLNVVESEGPSATSMIVPVWVSSQRNPDSERLVYALLDSQSDTVFIDREVRKELQADSRPVNLKLTTLLDKDVIMQTEKVSGLRVRGFNSSVVINLPTTYTKDYIPVNHTHIPTRETARHWKHLSAIMEEIPPLQNCGVGLLIGYSCSRALAPKQVILGEEEEPYAVCTELGWSIVGRSIPHHNKDLPSLSPTEKATLTNDKKDNAHKPYDLPQRQSAESVETCNITRRPKRVKSVMGSVKTEPLKSEPVRMDITEVKQKREHMKIEDNTEMLQPKENETGGVLKVGARRSPPPKGHHERQHQKTLKGKGTTDPPLNEWRLRKVSEATMDKDELMSSLCIGERKLDEKEQHLFKMPIPVQKLSLQRDIG